MGLLDWIMAPSQNTRALASPSSGAQSVEELQWDSMDEASKQRFCRWYNAQHSDQSSQSTIRELKKTVENQKEELKISEA